MGGSVIVRNSTHAPHAAVTLPNNRQDKYHRVSEIPGGSSSNFFTHYFHFATGKTVEDQTERDKKMQEHRG